jgi:Plasmid encoded RepA protein
MWMGIAQSHQEFHNQLSLALERPQAPAGAVLDVSFLTRFFCLTGLPVGRPKNTHFTRQTEEFSLTINAPTLGLPGGGDVAVGLPWGPKARLLTIWMSTAVQDPSRSADDRWLEIGRIKPWLASIGVRVHGDAPGKTKEQLIKLTFANYTMIAKRSGTALIRNQQLVDRAVFADKDLPHYAADALDKVRWPMGIELSQTAFQRFREDLIPIPTARLAEISHSAMAIDTFVFLSYRLPTIPQGEDVLVPWRDLAVQFGSGESPGRFKDSFAPTINAAMRAYPEAKVLVMGEGLRMWHSPPAELRRAFVAVPSSPAVKQRKLRNRVEVPEDNKEDAA